MAEVARKEATESNVEKVKLLLSEVTVSQKTKVDVMMFCVTVKRWSSDRPLCGSKEESQIAGDRDSIVTCKECLSLARRMRHAVIVG